MLQKKSEDFVAHFQFCSRNLIPHSYLLKPVFYVFSWCFITSLYYLVNSSCSVSTHTVRVQTIRNRKKCSPSLKD